MTFDELLAAVGIAEAPEAWRAGWDAAQGTYPAGEITFLTDTFLDEANATLRLSDRYLQHIRAALATVRGDEALRRLAWLQHDLLFRQDISRQGIFSWPAPLALGPAPGWLSAIITISGVPQMLELHRQRGIPREISVDTLDDVARWLGANEERYGVPCFDHLYWLSYHLRGELFRLGRLQFQLGTMYNEVHVFRRDGEVLALSEAGIRFRRDGLVDGTNEIFDEDAWTAEYTADGDRARGNPISPDGHARPEPVELDLREWQEVLSPGDPVLHVHIPAGSKMDGAACLDSYRRALDFFPRYFPEFAFRAFACSSWLLDSQFAQLLPATSNIVQFVKSYYTYPVKSGDEGAFDRVFGGRPADLAAAPRDTALRRAILDFTQTGNRLRGATGFILRDDPRWG
ncbi:MAG: acyltransferase domain-containing protein [Armatimonadota bacterium]